MQEWNNKAEEDKKRYEHELAKWKSEGGDEAIKAAKKQAKKEKRAAEGKTTTKSSKPKAASTSAEKTLSSAGTGTSYKSKEYIESSDSSDQKFHKIYLNQMILHFLQFLYKCINIF